MSTHEHGADCGCGEEHFLVRITTSSSGARVSTNLSAAPLGVRSAVLAALAAHLDVPHALEPLAKGEELPQSKANVDARYPVLEHLIEQARRDWATYGEQLVQRVYELMRGSPVLSVEQRKQIEKLFQAHEAAIILRFSGVGDEEARRRAVQAGFLKRGSVIWSDTDIAFRAGLGLDALEQAVQAETPERARAQVANVVEAFGRQPMTATDELALDFARRRSARLMRRPIQDQHDAIRAVIDRATVPELRGGLEATARLPGEAGATPTAEEGGGSRNRVLTPAEYERVRPTIERAILERRSERELASDLRAAVAGTALTNEMLRVARTELRSAHAEGAYESLKAQSAELGISDPEVYKLTSPTGCKQCIRIWGRGGSTRYRLSQVEAWEAQGGNYGRPAANWGPTIGPVHPNCFPAGTLITVQGRPGGKPIEAVQVGDVVLTHVGRWRPVTAIMRREATELHRIRTFSGRTLEGTAEHPIMTPEGWVEMQHLRAGSRVTVLHDEGLLRSQATGMTAVVCEKSHRLSGRVPVFNFSVDEDESYVANGIVVHNCTCGPLLVYVGPTQHAAVLSTVQTVMAQIRADRGQGE